MTDELTKEERDACRCPLCREHVIAITKGALWDAEDWRPRAADWLRVRASQYRRMPDARGRAIGAVLDSAALDLDGREELRGPA